MAFAETFKALSDPERRKILELLKTGPMSAGDIASNFDTTGGYNFISPENPEKSRPNI